MSDIVAVVETSETIVIETSSTVVVESDFQTEIDPEGELTLVLFQETTEVLVELPHDVERLVPGLQGPRGLPGTGAGTTLVEAATDIQARHAVALNSDGKAFQASADLLDSGSRLLGVAAYAAMAGENVSVVSDGLLESGPAWTPGPLFLGLNGELVSDPSLSQFQLQIAVAVNPSLLIVRPQFPIIL